MYPHKFISAEGEHIKNGEYTNNFKRWCDELGHFTDQHWKRSYGRIEGDIKAAAKMGEDIWPPSSVAVIAYSEPPICAKMYKPFDRARGIEDQTAKAHRKEVGAKECGDILSTFD
jgi:hypothetical protein